MNKFKVYYLLLAIVFILTACSPKHETINNNPSSNSVVTAKSNTEKTETENSSDSNIKSEPIEKNSQETEPQSKEQIKEINGFVLLTSLDKNLIIDLKYSTTDNFTKKVIYPNNVCLLRKSTAEKLVKANSELMKLGYKIKVWDGYRPIYVQKIFWDIVKDSRFVANPNTGGSIHNKGCAVDITLVDKSGNELTMPSKFDDFSTNAYRNNSKMSNEAKKNMELLTKYMVNSGFTTIQTEWWHFDDIDSKKYTAEDIDLNLFIDKN